MVLIPDLWLLLYLDYLNLIFFRMHVIVESGSLRTDAATLPRGTGADQLPKCNERSLFIPQRKHETMPGSRLKSPVLDN